MRDGLSLGPRTRARAGSRGRAEEGAAARRTVIVVESECAIRPSYWPHGARFGRDEVPQVPVGAAAEPQPVHHVRPVALQILEPPHKVIRHASEAARVLIRLPRGVHRECVLLCHPADEMRKGDGVLVAEGVQLSNPCAVQARPLIGRRDVPIIPHKHTDMIASPCERRP